MVMKKKMKPPKHKYLKRKNLSSMMKRSHYKNNNQKNKSSQFRMKSRNLNRFKSTQSSWPYADSSKSTLRKITNQPQPNSTHSTRSTPLFPLQKPNNPKSPFYKCSTAFSNRTLTMLSKHANCKSNNNESKSRKSTSISTQCPKLMFTRHLKVLPTKLIRLTVCMDRRRN